jgi:hypothetical protein
MQRVEANIAGSSVTCQSGLPDIASRSLDDGAKSGSPPGLTAARKTS